jgi:hypothetical protein
MEILIPLQDYEKTAKREFINLIGLTSLPSKVSSSTKLWDNSIQNAFL